ncbi:hypothetical protein FQN50_005470 [Emmonsiellopsis sp. PD_5]|nr:hypothetical protein FQN50_005470 [Emmonsiellopsis sp. PD_5]
MAARNGVSRNPQLPNEQSKANGTGTDRTTRVLPVHTLNAVQDTTPNLVARWTAEYERGSTEARSLLEAAEALRTSDVPVAFPTETVYGLGADATRSAAVQGIYRAKQRPSDNPLIVHVSSREQLVRILNGSPNKNNDTTTNDTNLPNNKIPPIYEPLLSKFWPGPLTIILPNPPSSPLAAEVTSTLPTFGARMPSSPLARLLIHLADTPLAAPSANASTKPSPTTAQHVYTDLQGRIEIILDGGACGVGVESTVVDGLHSPPAILRPGGVGIEEIRACAGWEDVRVGYKDGALRGVEAPRAPGMKYKHYSPKARVVLFEAGAGVEGVRERVVGDLVKQQQGEGPRRIGVVRTKCWRRGLGIPPTTTTTTTAASNEPNSNAPGAANQDDFTPTHLHLLAPGNLPIEMFDVTLGGQTESIARGLFSALRGLDEEKVAVIYVEGISDTEGDLAAAIMNRLRKAAEEEVRG